MSSTLAVFVQRMKAPETLIKTASLCVRLFSLLSISESLVLYVQGYGVTTRSSIASIYVVVIKPVLACSALWLPLLEQAIMVFFQPRKENRWEIWTAEYRLFFSCAMKRTHCHWQVMMKLCGRCMESYPSFVLNASYKQDTMPKTLGQSPTHSKINVEFLFIYFTSNT